MLPWLLNPLRNLIPVLNVFRYITFRVAAAVVTALILSWLMGPWFIRQLRRLSVGQNIRDVGPQAHQVKAGTPTMGGLLILFATLVPTLLWGDLGNVYVRMTPIESRKRDQFAVMNVVRKEIMPPLTTNLRTSGVASYTSTPGG